MSSDSTEFDTNSANSTTGSRPSCAPSTPTNSPTRSSPVGHDGTLFGTEQTLGQGLIPVFDIDPRFTFDVCRLPQNHRTSLRA